MQKSAEREREREICASRESGAATGKKKRLCDAYEIQSACDRTDVAGYVVSAYK